jgi:hypothetical protein
MKKEPTATKLTFETPLGTWTKVTIRPADFNLGVFGLDAHGHAVAVAWCRTAEDAESQAAKARQEGRYRDIIVRGPTASEEVSHRLARRSSCGISWIG